MRTSTIMRALLAQGAVVTPAEDDPAAVDIAFPDEPVMVGCVCNNGKVYAGGVMPSRCPHCGGSGSLPRAKYRAITAPTSETHRPLEDQ